MDLIEVMERFPDQESCIAHIEKVRWGDTPRCPHCDGTHVGRRNETKIGAIGRWNCHDCQVSFKVVHGTLFHGTKVPLQKWFLAISLMMNAKKSLSSCQLARDLDLNQKTVWYMQVRIRAEMASQESGVFLKGIIEADETYIGGKPRKKNKKSDRDDAPKNPRGRGTSKTSIVGAVERGGKVVASMLEKVTGRELVKFITSKVKALKDSTLISDEYTAYKEIGKQIDHKVINHSEQFVDGETHTNTIEDFWSLLKRAWYGLIITIRRDIRHFISLKRCTSTITGK